MALSVSRYLSQPKAASVLHVISSGSQAGKPVAPRLTPKPNSMQWVGPPPGAHTQALALLQLWSILGDHQHQDHLEGSFHRQMLGPTSLEPQSPVIRLGDQYF